MTPLRFVKGRLDDEVAATPVNTVKETVVTFPSGTLDGVILQVELTGIPVQANVTVPETFEFELSRSGNTAF